jgi:hypothetical protein
MYLLTFVNEIRAAQSRVPLQAMPIGGLLALEEAMGCALEGGLMHFGSPLTAAQVATELDLPLGAAPHTVVLPPAIDRCARTLAAEDADVLPDPYAPAAAAS